MPCFKHVAFCRAVQYYFLHNNVLIKKDRDKCCERTLLNERNICQVKTYSISFVSKSLLMKEFGKEKKF